LFKEFPEKASPAVSAREAYVRELRVTGQHLAQAIREERLARNPRVSLTFLFNQATELEKSFARLETEEAAERAKLAASPQSEVLLARFDEASETRRAAHRHLVGLLEYLREVLPSGDYREAVQAISRHFAEFPVSVESFTARQGLSPVDSLPIRENVVDISGLRAAGEPLPLAARAPVPAAAPPADGPPVPEDSQENLEIVFTPEITDLAASLGNDPLTIYQYVKNNCHYDPYLGSRRGADETRRLRAGNDMDLASLLIALLRVSGYPARYATGMAELTPEQAMNWLGVKDARTAGSILTTASLEGTTISDGADIVAIRCRRVWVEAYLPFSDYRGTGAAGGEPAWIPLDPAMKTYDNQFGLDLASLSGFDSDAFVLEYVSTTRPESVREFFDQKLAAFAAANYPDLDYPANRYSRSIVPEESLWLPGSLPFRVLSRDDSWPEVPSNKRFFIRIHIHGEGATLDHTMALPAIAGKQVTLSYIGATQADQDYLAANGGVFGVPNPAVVKMRPQLRVDGCVVADGTGSVTLGVVQQSDTTFTSPTPQDDVQTINNTVIAGNYEGHAFATGRTLIPPGESPDTKCEEDYLGWYLHRLGMQYLDRTDKGEDGVAALMQAVVLKDVSNAILGQRITVGYIGGVPQTFTWFGLGVDADRSIVSSFSTTGTSIGYDFIRVSGADGSLQENRVFEEEIGYEAVSTIKILALANDQSIPVWTITGANAAQYIPQLTHPASVVNKVIDSINAGQHVTIPRDPIQYFSWSGTGYIDLDPGDGGAGYIISGGGSGGDTVEEEDPPPGCTGATITGITPSEANNTYSSCDNRTIVIEVEMRSYDEDCNSTGTTTKEVKFVPSALGEGQHPFRFGGGGDCGGCTEDSVTITVVDTGITVKDSDSRVAKGHLLEIVPQGIGEPVACSVLKSPDPNPKWTVTGALNKTLFGKSVSFRANSWFVNSIDLYGVTPKTYWVVLDNCEAPFTIRAYPNDKSSIQFGAMDVDSFLKAVDAFNDIVEKVGSPLSITPSFGGTVSFENQWKEISGSNLAAYTWSFGGEISAGITAKVSFGTGLLGLPPPLAEAAVFVSLGGKVGLKGTASLNTAKQFQVEGGSFGSVTVGVGGEVSVASGFISITLVAESGVEITAFFGGTSEPAEVYAQTKVEAGQLDLSYKTGAFWGIWESSETWRVWEPWKLYENKVVILPWK